MKSFFYALLITFLTLGLSGAARADVAEGTLLSAEQIAPLMSWVARQTGAQVSVLPKVLVSHEKFVEVTSRLGRLQGRARSVYVPGMVILDARSWDEEDDTQISLLVHELVHHAQLTMHKAWACPDAREAQAYTLQNQWLEEKGHNPFVQASWVRRISACRTAPGTELALAQSGD